MKRVVVAGAPSPVRGWFLRELADRGAYEPVEFPGCDEGGAAKAFALVAFAPVDVAGLVDVAHAERIRRLVVVSSLLTAPLELAAEDDELAVVHVRLPLVCDERLFTEADSRAVLSLPQVSVAPGALPLLTCRQGAQAIVGAMEFGEAGTVYDVGGTDVPYRRLAILLRGGSADAITVADNGLAPGLPPVDGRADLARRSFNPDAAASQDALRYFADNVEAAVREAVRSLLAGALG